MKCSAQNVGDNMRQGFHSHKCSNKECGHIWQHSNKCGGNIKAHMCPKCGTYQLWQYDFKKPNLGIVI